jgi:thymidylate synthase (FAD)
MEVTLIDKMGTDALVVDSARVSFSKEASNYTEEQNAKLINYLARHQHFTPFTHPQIVVREKVPIFVARQRFKHTVGFSYNEVSRRYVDDKPEFYIPDGWRQKADNKKQGSMEELVASNKQMCDLYAELINFVSVTYAAMLEYNVAPELARMVLPQSMYTEYFVTGSLAAFARAYKLRSEEHAQKEIQDLAVEWDKLIRPLFPVSWAALVD